ncbi:hypothetical protein QR680_018023 [Steinernema hermaphroditum]|uniref:7TM GPCR serpentine receptor class x (Srx) domain-containing protein n=1 Tax=Steinernema hermaphroditum TaxID=289476 RepID=A0AA39HJ10_9BILA|nr:hypothetical protein QR680_018023 [Steinernema hermaphroditum]
MISRIKAGILLLLLTVPGLICSLTIIWIMVWSRRLRKMVAYRILFQLSIAECILLVGHVVSATMPLTNSTYGYWFQKVLSAVLQSFYICVLLLNAVLAFNRLYINTVAGAHSSDKTYKVIALACYVFVSVEFLCYLTPYCSMDFSLKNFDWVYDAGKDTMVMSYIVEQEKVVALGAILFELACYIGIFAIITKRRSAVVTSISTPYNPEYRILLTSLIAFVYQVVMIVPFHFGHILFPDAERIHLLNAATWAFFPSLQQISILTLNSEFRKRFLRMIYARKELTFSAHVSSIPVVRRRNHQLT